jgi:hypothetical protein
MRIVVAAAAALLSLSPVFAQTPPAHIDFLEVEGSGFADPADVIAKNRIMRYLSRTPSAAAHKGLAFGMTAKPVGQPDGADVTLRWIWKMPRPGMKDDKTGKFVREIVEETPAKVGSSIEHHKEFREDAEIVRGKWRLEVWNERRRLAVRRFALK